MKKITSLLSLLSWLSLLTFFGIELYQANFALTSTLQSLQTTYQEGVLYLFDFSAIDLNYALYAFAVVLYLLSLVLAFFKLLFQGRLFTSFSFLIHLSLTLAILLAILNDATLLTTLINDTQSASLSSQIGAYALFVFVGLSILSFLLLLLSFIRQPVKTIAAINPVVNESDYLADELKRFVVPNQVSVQIPPVVPSPLADVPPTVAMLQPQPVVQTPPLDTNRRLDELKARETVQQIKEKIRLIIRAHLAQLPPLEPSLQPGTPAPVSAVSEDVVRTMVTELFQQEFQRLIQQQKEDLSSLVNEELIKYDALNREVIETMINEKIEQQTVQALQHVEDNRHEVSSPKESIFVTKDELASALASLQPGLNQEDVIRSVVLSLLAKDTNLVRRSELPSLLGSSSSSEVKPNEQEVTSAHEESAPLVANVQPFNNQPAVETSFVLAQETSVTAPADAQATVEVETDRVGLSKVSSKKKKTIEPKEVRAPLMPSNDIVISPEEQFKSVLPADSKVTRTGKKKIVRISFQKRMSTASLEQKQHYDELKNYVLSYRVKSRVSSVGDMFRLHKEEYLKIAIAGKGLKLYLALDPKDYENSTIPVDDASDKKMYQNIPLVFRVKSELSVKRAKVLIDDLMRKKNLPQKDILDLPWSKQFSK